jgi:LPXTG-motif cell wall-anchored protein
MAEARSDSLACPRCALRYPLEERFCAKCGMPLTYAGQLNAEQPVTERHERARKVKPVYSRGELRRVAIGRQQPEAEFIQMLLLEEGVPSTLRRTAGFDVPDMLAAGPRDVLVPESGLETAREVLLEADIESAGAAPATPQTGERRSAAMLLLGILLGAGLLGLLTTIVVIVQNN